MRLEARFDQPVSLEGQLMPMQIATQKLATVPQPEKQILSHSAVLRSIQQRTGTGG